LENPEKNENIPDKKNPKYKISFWKKKSGTHISEIIFKDSFVFSAGIGCAGSNCLDETHLSLM